MSQIVFLENSLPYRQPEMISVLRVARKSNPRKANALIFCSRDGVSDQNKGLTETSDHAWKANQRMLHLVY